MFRAVVWHPEGWWKRWSGGRDNKQRELQISQNSYTLLRWWLDFPSPLSFLRIEFSACLFLLPGQWIPSFKAAPFRWRALGIIHWYSHLSCLLSWDDPWRRAWQPTLAFLPGESHGQRSLVGLQSIGSQRFGQDWRTQHVPISWVGSLHFWHAGDGWNILAASVLY